MYKLLPQVPVTVQFIDCGCYCSDFLSQRTCSTLEQPCGRPSHSLRPKWDKTEHSGSKTGPEARLPWWKLWPDHLESLGTQFDLESEALAWAQKPTLCIGLPFAGWTQGETFTSVRHRSSRHLPHHWTEKCTTQCKSRKQERIRKWLYHINSTISAQTLVPGWPENYCEVSLELCVDKQLSQEVWLLAFGSPRSYSVFKKDPHTPNKPPEVHVTGAMVWV